MSGNRTGPAANAASGDVQHVQPSSEQTDDTGKGTATKRARDPFVVKKDTWLRRARADKCLTDSAFRILSFISDHAGIRSDGFTWFSHATIAGGTGMSISAARRGIQNAKSRDFLRVVVRGDKGKSNECWPCLDGNPLVGKFPPIIQEPHAVTGSGGSSISSTPPCSNSSTPTQFETEQAGRSELSTPGARNRTTTFLSDPLNDPPKTTRRRSSSTITYGAQPTDDDEIKRIRDLPETRNQAKELCRLVKAGEVPSKQLRSLARGLARLVVLERLDFEDHVVPTVILVYYEEGTPVGGPNCRWLETHVAPAARALRDGLPLPDRRPGLRQLPIDPRIEAEL